MGVIAYFLFSPSDESFPLDGNVSVPATVKLGDKFEIVINLTNSTAESIFIKHVELSNFLDAPTILNGAKLLSVEPEMDFEQTYANTFQYSYFREIKPGETQTVIFYMQAESTGTYYENVGVYAKHPLLGEPAFLVAFHINAIEIEITP